MALTLRGTPTQLLQGTAATTVTVPVPAGIVAGDLMICHVVIRTGTVNTVVAGWTHIASNANTGPNMAVFYRISAGGEPASYNFPGIANTAVRATASMIAYQGGLNQWDTVTPIGVISNTPDATTTATVTAASMTVAQANSNIFLFTSAYSTGATETMTPPTVPAAFTQVTRVGTLTERAQQQVSLLLWTGSGATGAMTTTITTALAGTVKGAIAFALNPGAASPSVSTDTAEATGATTATGTGNATVDNGSPITAKGIVYSSVNAIPTLADSVQPSGATGLGTFTSNLTGLTANTLYYARAYATNANGTGYGSVLTFTTFANTATVSTQNPTNIAGQSAIFNGTISDLGQASVTAHGFVYSTVNAVPTLADTVIDNGAATVTGTYTANVSTLAYATVHYVRAYATNSFGTAYGSAIQFTSGNPPSTVDGCKFILTNVAAGNRFCSTPDPSRFTNCTFVGGGGHAIRVTSTGTFSLSNNQFTGFGVDGSTGAAILNDSGGLVTINITNGGSAVTYKNGVGATTVINNTRTLELTGLIAGSRVAVISQNGTPDNYEDDTEVAGTTNSGTTFTYDYNWTGVATVVNIKVIHPSKGLIELPNISLGANGVSLPIQPTTDRQYNNPV